MKNLNKVILIGNLTRDPEVRQTTKGASVAELGLAVNRRVPGGDGAERREETTYVDVVLWNKQADLAGQFLQKGRSVYVEGRLQLETWEDRKTGQKRQKMRVVGERMEFADGPPRDGAGEREGGRRREYAET
ncbi:MAG: single-stranded DNA-binding protein [Verrucomicrobiota bacterium]